MCGDNPAMFPLLLSALLAQAVFAPQQSGPQDRAGETRPPNVVVILADDAGYADFSVHGCKQFATPRIDSIAARGVLCRQGYVTASVCSPSRAGLMTGRYQQRFGHETNIPPRYSEENGLPVDEAMMPEILRGLGYRTIGLGKWHLGYAPKFHPLNRGFDDFFGFLQGSRSYFPIEQPTRLNRLLRDREVIPEGFAYLTDTLGDEAARYIAAHRDQPFFLYLAFTAVHTPMHAIEEDLAQVAAIERPRRRKLAAMTLALDRAVGKVLDALDAHGLSDDTLLFFLNDNGGARTNASSNGVLRGKKGSPFEGGIRVPFLVQWPGHLPAGKVFDAPVSALDVLPTAVAAAGLQWSPHKALDGVDLLPYLRGGKQQRPHEVLFWRIGGNRAVRQGDLKLVSHRGGPWMLFDLANDEREQRDLAGERPDEVSKLIALCTAWEQELVAPRWGR